MVNKVEPETRPDLPGVSFSQPRPPLPQLGSDFHAEEGIITQEELDQFGDTQNVNRYHCVPARLGIVAQQCLVYDRLGMRIAASTQRQENNLAQLRIIFVFQ